MSQAKLMPPQVLAKPRISPSKPTLNPSYSQIVKTSFAPRAHDPGNPHVTTCDFKSSRMSHVTTHDPGKASGDLSRDWPPTQSLGHVNFKHITHLLTHIWQTVGITNERVRNQQGHKTLNNWGNSPTCSKHPNRRTPIRREPHSSLS